MVRPVLTLALLVSTGACSLQTNALADPPGMDGSICSPSVETCNGGDDDCDGTADEGFDTDTDPSHCGGCGNACPTDPAHAAAACAAGSCTLRCDPGFADCDAEAANGCEADLARPETCGDCASTCADPTPLCQTMSGSSACVSACASGLTECGMSCVDTTADPSHCGGCDVSCPDGTAAARTCTAGVCGYACDDGFGDCDGDTANGCEQSFGAVEHCGACDALCAPAAATGMCVAGACEIGVCDAGFGDCNTDSADGCEESLTTLTDCGACGTACSLPNASATCDTGTCEVDTCDDGFEDCNGDRTDGCEIDTETDPRNCGACGTTCAGACTPGGCVLETSCDGLDDNGNGVIDEGTICPCPVAHRMGHTYMFCNSSVNWTTARDRCVGRGYALVTLDDAAENTFVATTAAATSSSNRWWMGYNDRTTEGTWVWVGAAATGTYVGWVGDEPNNSGCCGGEDCGELDAAGGWVDTGCGDSNYYVCEVD
jgi:hypothetical protein